MILKSHIALEFRIVAAVTPPYVRPCHHHLLFLLIDQHWENSFLTGVDSESCIVWPNHDRHQVFIVLLHVGFIRFLRWSFHIFSGIVREREINTHTKAEATSFSAFELWIRGQARDFFEAVEGKNCDHNCINLLMFFSSNNNGNQFDSY